MGMISRGKVRDIYNCGEKNILIVTTDRISAFDVIFPNPVDLKGIILNKLSEFWFEITKDIMPNHFVTSDNSKMPEEFQTLEFEGRCTLAKKLKMLPVECIVRGYLAGSGWESYQKNGSICGIELPEGLLESEQLPEIIFTPTTKAAEGHDMPISFEKLIEIVGEERADQLRDKSIEIYAKCAEYARSKGIIIADTKFEFGVDEAGVLYLADEVLTPDSSRFWPANEYEIGRAQKSFDKQYLRDWLEETDWNKMPPAPLVPLEVLENTAEKYIQAFEIITERDFEF